jgi:MFS family permease
MSGIVVIGGGLGALIAPPIANQLILAYDWRLSYIVIGSVYLVVVIIASQFLKRDPSQIGKTAYGENGITRGGFNQASEDFSLKEAVGTKQFWMLFAMVLCTGIMVQAAMIHMAPYATDIGISATGAASILATTGAASIAGRIILGNIGDRMGNRKAYAISFMLMLIAYLLLLQANEMWKLYIFAVVFGLAWGGSMAQHAPIVATFFGLSSHGLIFGLVGTGFTIGAALGPVIAGYIFDVTNRYQVAFIVTAVITLIGLIITILLKPLTYSSTE